MTITKEFQSIYKLFPKKFKRRSILFILLIIFSSLLETIGIGIIFPLIEILINGNFQSNFIGLDLTKYFSNLNQGEIIKILVIGIILFYFFKTIFLVLYNYWQLKFSHGIFKHLSFELFTKYLKCPIVFYHKKNSSILMRNTIFEARNYGNCVNLFLKIIAELLVILFIFCLVILIEPKATSIITFAVLTFILVFYFVTSKRIYNYGEKKLSSAQSAIKVLNESFNGIRDIKLKSSEQFFFGWYKFFLDKTVKAGNYQEAIVASPRYIFEFMLISLLFIGLLLYLNINNNILEILPLLSIYVVASYKIVPSVMRILSMLQTIKGLQPSIEMLNKEFGEQSALNLNQDNQNSKKLIFNDLIEFKNINFSYEKGKNIFKNFSSKIEKNKIIGISGNSGSGKSTLIDLLTGLLKPTSGEVLIDGKLNIHDGYLKSWQKKVGYVSQNVYLFDASIKENIALGENKNQIDDAKIEKVLKIMQLYSFIENLENKIDTQVGQRGVKLSGGQIQRIGIAREIYRGPELLILDEATNSLDQENEMNIFNNLKQLKQKLTIIIISHSRNTLKICDNILDLNIKSDIEKT